jgi:hypothetical protein
MIAYESAKVQTLINNIKSQFNARAVVEGQKCSVGFGIDLDIYVDEDNVLWLNFSKGEEKHSITVPMPFIENGVVLIQQNEVLRAICSFWLEQEQREMDYIDAIFQIIIGKANGLIPAEMLKSTSFLQSVIYSIKDGNAYATVYRFQQAVNEIVHKMPLHETVMNSFVMNNRLIIIDGVFEELTSPDERLAYQVKKARKYFDRGWTSIGLSDGTLADKNYLLKTDLRKFSAFGERYHNPQRNLYSTLGMKGDELPIIRSQSMQNLMDCGITRKGWNMFTAFVDIPDIFEDQIMVDESHADKFVTYERRYQLFGQVCVKAGDKIRTGDLLGVAPDEERVLFDTECDTAKVKKVAVAWTSVGGVPTKSFNVIVSYTRNFRDGVKITNTHGNKGIIRLKKLGFAIDPRTGEKRKIDVIVGAKTVGKRRNYGQVMEALMNDILEADGIVEPVVLDDNWSQDIEEVKTGLARRGFNKNGQFICNTYAGRVRAVCGKVFWGVIKTAEDQVWKEDATIDRNGKEIRTAGLKLSHVEFRAIETRFGEDSAILDEIMTYVQGSENLNELLMMARAKLGVLPVNKVVLDYKNVRPVDQAEGSIVPGHLIGGTVVDEFFHPDGFVLNLPLGYMTTIDRKGEAYSGSPLAYESMSDAEKAEYKKVYVTNQLYIPSGILRKCWRHGTGKFGLSEIGVLINNVMVMIERLTADPENPVHIRLYYVMLNAFFTRLSAMLGTKRGEIATHAMSVRYPFSVKAVATLSTTLPKNTVEIHRSMANILKVQNGDVVLAERFPCLGFMSVRPQKVRITDDPLCKYVIRVSGNSLVSLNLDFDGDVIYLASFHTPAAKLELIREWTNPNITCYRCIQALNERKGAPHIKEYEIDDFKIVPFKDLTNEEHSVIVEKNTGVKAQTGPVIALTYNIMRIVENSNLAKDQKMKVAVEMFLEKAAQSVFEQKHGGRSLYEVVIEGICTANVEMLVEVGFKRGTTEKLCGLIVERAKSMNVFDLVKHHEAAIANGGSNIISKIVKKYHRIYFASRAKLEVTRLLDALDAPAVDIPSKMFKWATSGKADQLKTVLDKVLDEKKLEGIRNQNMREAASSLCESIDSMFSENSHEECEIADLKNAYKNARRECKVCQAR